MQTDTFPLRSFLLISTNVFSKMWEWRGWASFSLGWSGNKMNELPPSSLSQSLQARLVAKTMAWRRWQVKTGEDLLQWPSIGTAMEWFHREDQRKNLTILGLSSHHQHFYERLSHAELGITTLWSHHHSLTSWSSLRPEWPGQHWETLRQGSNISQTDLPRAALATRRFLGISVSKKHILTCADIKPEEMEGTCKGMLVHWFLPGSIRITYWIRTADEGKGLAYIFLSTFPGDSSQTFQVKTFWSNSLYYTWRN